MNDYDKAMKLSKDFAENLTLTAYQEKELTVLLEKVIALSEWEDIYHEEFKNMTNYQDLVKAINSHLQKENALNDVNIIVSKSYDNQNNEYQENDLSSVKQLLTSEEIALLLAENETLLEEYDINKEMELSKYEKYDKGRKTHIRVEKKIYDEFSQLCQTKFGNKRHAALLVNLFMKEFINDKKRDQFFDLLYK